METTHRSAVHRYLTHPGARADCRSCQLPASTLMAARIALLNRQLAHPENVGAAVRAELRHWFRRDLVDIAEGRGLTYIPNLP